MMENVMQKNAINQENSISSQPHGQVHTQEQEETQEKENNNIQAGKAAKLKEGITILFSSGTAMTGLIIVLFWVFVALMAPYITAYGPMDKDWKAPNQGPPWHTPWGPTSWAGISGPGWPTVPGWSW